MTLVFPVFLVLFLPLHSHLLHTKGHQSPGCWGCHLRRLPCYLARDPSSLALNSLIRRRRTQYLAFSTSDILHYTLYYISRLFVFE